jgi:hypothetical protein
MATPRGGWIGFLLVVSFCLLLFPANSAAMPPDAINYQGYLTNAQGAPVNGNVDLLFSLWDAPSGGSELWNEVISGMAVSQGIFEAVLGATNPLPDAIFANPLWLEIRVNGEVLSPRKAFKSAPYAMRARQVDLDRFTILGASCSPGQIPKWTGSSWACADDLSGPGDITAVIAGEGLSGGGPSGEVTLSADTGYLQRRVSGSCTPGSSIRAIDANGAVICQPDANSGGTVTQVNSGSGLAGGPITGSGTLSVDFAGTGTAQTAARSDHQHDILYQKKYGKVAVVAKSGGDYPDPVSAMSNRGTWCGTASAANPCLLKIMPGEYDLGTANLTMQPYIDIEGSGENVTKIRSGTSAQGVVNGADNAEIRLLSIEHVGGVALARGFYNDSTSPKMYRLTISVSGGTSGNFAVYNRSSSPQMSHLTITAAGPSTNYGLFVDLSTLAFKNLNVSSLGGTQGMAVHAQNSTLSIEDSTITASGATSSITMGFDGSAIYLKNLNLKAQGGSNSTYCLQTTNASTANVFNTTCTASGNGTNILFSNSNSSIILTNVAMEAKEGTYNHGIWSHSDSELLTIKINHSVIKASDYTIYNGEHCSTYVGNSQLDGGPSANFGTLVCAGVYDENYAFYTGPSCP